MKEKTQEDTPKSQEVKTAASASEEVEELLKERAGEQEEKWITKKVKDPVSGKQVATNTKYLDYVEKYHLVIFTERSSLELESKGVELTVNGETLLYQRDIKVPVPERFLKCADHTKQEEYKQEPGKPRTIQGYKQTYTYHIVGDPIPKSLYDKFKKEGDEAVKNYLAAQKKED